MIAAFKKKQKRDTGNEMMEIEKERKRRETLKVKSFFTGFASLC